MSKIVQNLSWAPICPKPIFGASIRPKPIFHLYIQNCPKPILGPLFVQTVQNLFLATIWSKTAQNLVKDFEGYKGWMDERCFRPLGYKGVKSNHYQIVKSAKHLPNCQFTLFHYISFPIHCLVYIIILSFLLLQISHIYLSNISFHIKTHNFYSFPIQNLVPFLHTSSFQCYLFEVCQPSVWLLSKPRQNPSAYNY